MQMFQMLSSPCQLSPFHSVSDVLAFPITSGGISTSAWTFENIVRGQIVQEQIVQDRGFRDQVIQNQAAQNQAIAVQRQPLSPLSYPPNRMLHSRASQDPVCPIDLISRRIVITVDGLSGSGKTTIGRALVNALGISHLESGYVLKAVAKALLADPIHPPLDQAESIADKLKSITLADVADPSLDHPEYAALVPVFSGLPEIQPLFYATVHRLSKQLGNTVITGRSIGNHFSCTNEPVRIFLIVSPEIGAYRKARQLEVITSPGATELATLQRNKEDIFNQVISVPPGALQIDTDRMTVDKVVAIAETAIRHKIIHSPIKL